MRNEDDARHRQARLHSLVGIVGKSTEVMRKSYTPFFRRPSKNYGIRLGVETHILRANDIYAICH